MIDRTMFYLFNKLSSEEMKSPTLDVISGMFFNYWKLMNSIGINTQTLNAFEIYNGLNACYDKAARTTADNLYIHGEVSAHVDFRVSYYETEHEIYDTYASCANLNEVLMEDENPEFHDTEPFVESLNEVVYDNIDYEIESETFTVNEDNIEWYKTCHPSDDKVMSYIYENGLNLDWDSLESFLSDKLNTIHDNNEDMHQTQVRKFMLDRLVGQNVNIIDGIELSTSEEE